MKAINRYLIITILLFPFGTYAQDVVYNGNPDTSFLNARELAFNGKREMARDTLKLILTKYPNYADVRNLLAKTYSWDSQYDEARKHFNHILSKEKDNKEVWVAAINNEFYSDSYATALGLSNKALLTLHEDTDILALKEKAIEYLNKKEEPKEEEDSEPKNAISVSTSLDLFDIVYDEMFYSSISYKRATKFGSIIPKINFSNRFETSALQFEVDMYPKLIKNFYAYLNYGFSSASIYPDHRIGGEIYASLPKSLEASAGFRHLIFDNSTATLITGSIGWYTGNYYFTLRPYITPAKNRETSVSGNIKARRYFKNKDNYLGVSASFGYAPELRQLRDNNVLLSETLLFIESASLSVEYQFTPSKYINPIGGTLGVTRQELVFDPGSFFWAISTGISYQFKF